MPFLSLIFIVLLSFADQILKTLASVYLKNGDTVYVIKGLLEFTYVENRGAAFGILQNQRWFFIAFTVILCLVLLYILFFYKKHDFFSKLACILIVAGGIGNLFDRIKLGYVIDYILVPFFSPVFNFADCCVVVGVIAAFIHIIFTAKEEGKDNEREA